MCVCLLAVRQPTDRRLRHDVGTGRRGRPKSARPTRTIVAPSSTATSKSSVMPIDSSRELERAPPARGARRTTGAGRRRAGGTVISPSTARPEPRQRRRRAARRRRGAQPPFCGSLAEVHLDEHPGAGRAAGDLRAELGAVDRLPAARPTARARAPCCAGAARGSASAARRGPVTAAPWPAAPGRGSRRGRSTPAATTARDPLDGDRLGRGDQRDVGGIAPGPARGGGDPLAHLGDTRRDLGRGHVSLIAVRTTTTRLAPGRAVAPVREVVGRRRGAHVDVGERRSTPARAERDAHRGREVERGRAVDGARRRPSGPSRSTRRSRRSAPNS